MEGQVHLLDALDDEISTWANKFAHRVGDLSHDPIAKGRFRAMVQGLCEQQNRRCIQYLEDLRLRDNKYAEDAHHNKRLCREEEGPPFEGWQWVRFFVEPPLCGWMPPDLDKDRIGEGCEGLHFPPTGRQHTMEEKYTLLAAIHDETLPIVDPIVTLEEEGLEVISFSMLKREVRSTVRLIKGKDKRNLDSFLADVRRDIEQHCKMPHPGPTESGADGVGRNENLPEKPSKQGKKIGRPITTDLARDKRYMDAWLQREHNGTPQSCAQDLGCTEKELRGVIDRERHRRNKSTE